MLRHNPSDMVPRRSNPRPRLKCRNDAGETRGCGGWDADDWDAVGGASGSMYKVELPADSGDLAGSVRVCGDLAC
jgi:hypothetical protein